MTEYFLSIGSNIEPHLNVPQCIRKLRTQFVLTRLSSVYETEPVGIPDSPNFWNLAAAVKTPLSRSDLNKELKRIEEQMGRVRDPNNKFAPRVIDIDILPQPSYLDQAFIIVPLAEIAPEEKDSATGKTFGEIGRKQLEKWVGFKRIVLKL